MRLSDVANKFDCCPTLLKQHCRKLGIERWPFRTASKVEKKRKRLRQKYGEDKWNALESKQLASAASDSVISFDTEASHLKQLEEAAEALQGAKRRVKIWNKVKRRKTAGMAAPFASSLIEYLESHPDCEVYNGQDLLPQSSLALSSSSVEDLPVTEMDPLDDQWCGSRSAGPEDQEFESEHFEEVIPLSSACSISTMDLDLISKPLSTSQVSDDVFRVLAADVFEEDWSLLRDFCAEPMMENCVPGAITSAYMCPLPWINRFYMRPALVVSVCQRFFRIVCSFELFLFACLMMY